MREFSEAESLSDAESPATHPGASRDRLTPEREWHTTPLACAQMAIGDPLKSVHQEHARWNGPAEPYRVCRRARTLAGSTLRDDRVGTHLLELEFCTVARWKDGEIVEENLFYDQVGFLRQIGVL